MEEATDELRRLRAAINDLVSLEVLPATWRGTLPGELIGSLLDVLLKMLHLDFAYARLTALTNGPALEIIRVSELQKVVPLPQAIGRALEPWLTSDTQAVCQEVPNPVGEGKICIADFWLGLAREIGVVVAGSQRKDFPTEIETVLLRAAVNKAVIELQRLQVLAANNRATESERLKDRLQTENIYLLKEVTAEQRWGEIVGHSKALKKVLKLVEQVAPTKACVLIEGETGTGKELIARAIHRLSGRKDRVFVKLNGGAIPTGLLESELFGHEKGAFTGAIAQKIGMFEFAHQGTIFLDEVSEIPLELQVKLLRVLQDQEFERLGSTRTIHVDVRLVAATNRDLRQMVEERLFRSDLFYRLNVFPIMVPPLRQRPEDIPSLVNFFVAKYSYHFGKPVDTIPVRVMDALRRWSWPGNVRELENFIARSIILSSGRTLEAPISELRPLATRHEHARTLEEAEREHIRKAVEASNWVIAGPHGAAARLGMRRTSLQYKMRKLGIIRPRGR